MPKYFIECHREGNFYADTWLTVEAEDRNAAKLAAAKQLSEEDPDDDGECLEEFFDDTYVLDSCTEVPANAPRDHSPIALLIHAVEEHLAGNPEPDVGMAAALASVNDWWAERYDVA